MKLLDRSPGLLVEAQSEKMHWPNLNLVPHLQNQGLPYQDSCDGIRVALNEGNERKLKSELNKLKKYLRKTIGPFEYFDDFVSRFKLEYKRELESLKRANYNSIKFTDEASLLGEQGFFIKTLSDENIQTLKDYFADDIKELNKVKPIRNFRNYDRNKFFTLDNTTELVNSILKKDVVLAASQYFGFDMHVYSVCLHISRPDDCHVNQVMSDVFYKPNTKGLHFDPKSGTIKCILYLNEVFEYNGAFKYLPKTHNLINPPLERLSAKANCTVNYLDSKKLRRLFMSLPEPMQKTSIFGSVTDDSDNLSRHLLNKEKHFLSENGNIIVFDPAMQHRGGDCTNGERVSLQIAIRAV
tara:strand:+ start:1542 stop:2603 length:1062 start_codon:yes stop_codon:yes gene_type:complete